MNLYRKCEDNTQKLYLTKTLPGQLFVLQALFSLSCPEQLLPLYCGVGSEQLLVRAASPPPQVTEHTDHAPHAVHFPSTNDK